MNKETTKSNEIKRILEGSGFVGYESTFHNSESNLILKLIGDNQLCWGNFYYTANRIDSIKQKLNELMQKFKKESIEIAIINEDFKPEEKDSHILISSDDKETEEVVFNQYLDFYENHQDFYIVDPKLLSTEEVEKYNIKPVKVAHSHPVYDFNKQVFTINSEVFNPNEMKYLDYKIFELHGGTTLSEFLQSTNRQLNNAFFSEQSDDKMAEIIKSKSLVLTEEGLWTRVNISFDGDKLSETFYLKVNNNGLRKSDLEAARREFKNLEDTINIMNTF